ncbi:MAG: transposase [Planctomycetes bacterium]|nr:transposase [Planctomycetota bacterium]
MDPLAFMARLAALVPRPRANLIRYHGVFAPNFKHRKLIVPKHSPSRHRDPDKPTAPLTWMQRLKRVFQIDPIAARLNSARTVAARCASSPPSKIPGSFRPSSLTSHSATRFPTHSHARRHQLSTTTMPSTASDHPILAATSLPFGPRPASASNQPPNSRPFRHFA